MLDAGTVVLAVEYNGYQGANRTVLAQASAHGRAASMFLFWIVNALTSLSFAEGGQVLASFEPGLDPVPGPAVAAALDSLDFEDYRDKEGRGLVALERLTRRGFTAADLERIVAAGTAFQVNR